MSVARAGTLRRDTYMSALQGGRAAEREYLSGVLPAPFALQLRECRAAGAESVSAMRIEGSIRHASREESWRVLCVVISITNERGEKIARHVVGAGALQPGEKLQT